MWLDIAHRRSTSQDLTRHSPMVSSYTDIFPKTLCDVDRLASSTNYSAICTARFTFLVRTGDCDSVGCSGQGSEDCHSATRLVSGPVGVSLLANHAGAGIHTLGFGYGSRWTLSANQRHDIRKLFVYTIRSEE